MLIIPAIDLKDGRCVRLRQGRADDVTAYSDDPVGMARHWVEAGARYLHVVDLDGAFQGHPVHADLVAAIARAIPIPVEIGGGLRTDADIRRMLDGGVARAIIGTRALASPEELRTLAETFGPRLAVGIDARDGRVQVRGWVETTDVRAADLAKAAEDAGVRTLIYTDTATDGMLRGPNTRAMRALCEAVAIDVIASGGVACAADVVALRALGRANLAGVIVGKALYDGAVALPELLAAAGGPEPAHDAETE
jgi:phosphoribosylformimino-5-aminoimidazole carboxamide ribotide isomerase